MAPRTILAAAGHRIILTARDAGQGRRAAEESKAATEKARRFWELACELTGVEDWP